MPIGKMNIITDNNILKNICYNSKLKRHVLNDAPLIGIGHLQIAAPRSHKESYLPVRLNNQVVYTLCRTCALHKSQEKCDHDEHERSFESTLVWPEIDFLVSLGYKILTIFEVYLYSDEKPILSKFMSILGLGKLIHSKVEEEEKKEASNNINLSLNLPKNLHVTEEDFQENSQLRSFYKHLLVGVLGKFAQKNSKTETRVVRSQSSLEEVFYREKIQELFPCKKICILFVDKASKSSINMSGNSIIYSYVTALSRIYVHKKMMCLEAVGAKIFSISNDSITFTLPHSSHNPLRESQLFGDFKNEYEPHFLQFFLSFGVKNQIVGMSCKTHFEMIIKARGFNLKHQNFEKFLTLPKFKKMIDSYCEGKRVMIKLPQIRSKTEFKNLTTKDILLHYCMSNTVDTNRILLKGLTSKPYGWN